MARTQQDTVREKKVFTPKQKDFSNVDFQNASMWDVNLNMRLEKLEKMLEEKTEKPTAEPESEPA